MELIIMDKSFDSWNSQKKELETLQSIIKFRQRDIIFMKIGLNIGYEQDGKGEEYLRPVLVYKKFSSRTFLGIPLTSKAKFDRFHFEFDFSKDKKSYAILSQIRLFDIKRAVYKNRTINQNDYKKLEISLKEFLSVTPLQKKGERVIAICEGSISKNISNVKKNILVTGSNGQLGREIKELSKEYPYNFYFTDRESLDITNLDKLNSFVIVNKIDTIINCAAYTAVDKAEQEQDLADKINHKAIEYLSFVAKDKRCKLIHISTDYVFDGKNYKPYSEDEKTNPQNIYGQTKLDGELAMQKINPSNSIIIRTSWVYSSFGANFVKTMLRLAKERESLGVIFDQVGTPTYAKHLAQTILDIIPKLDNSKVGVYHYSNEGVLSWYDFAKEIMKMAKIECQVNPIETKEYPTPASRPHYSLLNKAKIKKDFDIMIPYWKDGLDECLRKLGERR
jgi:dTDP-4-dehydrorhamnose reductase